MNKMAGVWKALTQKYENAQFMWPFKFCKTVKMVFIVIQWRQRRRWQILSNNKYFTTSVQRIIQNNNLFVYSNNGAVHSWWGKNRPKHPDSHKI